jgi:uncharacterized protein YbaA (DUF1428 family)
VQTQKADPKSENDADLIGNRPAQKKKENLMKYIDGFIAAVPTKNKEAYVRHVKQADTLFKKYGAIKLVECWGDDIKEGKITSFPQAVKCKENETVVFSWVAWPSKKVRDEGLQKLFEDPEMKSIHMPFDESRLIYGGFEVLINES